MGGLEPSRAQNSVLLISNHFTSQTNPLHCGSYLYVKPCNLDFSRASNFGDLGLWKDFQGQLEVLKWELYQHICCDLININTTSALWDEELSHCSSSSVWKSNSSEWKGIIACSFNSP